MTPLSELIRDTPAEELNTILKRSFSFLSDPVVVDSGQEENLLAILVNLTQPAKLKVSLLDEQAAQKLVQEESWQSSIEKAAGWLHTHNLKYPDSRARGRILLRDRLQTGANGKRFGWSYNAAWINYAKFLWTEFLFNSRLISVGEQLSGQDSDNVFIKCLSEWGFPETTLSQLQETCSLALKPCQPDFVSRYSPQILFPDDKGQYMAITPVVCSETQRRVYNLVKVPEITCRPVFHARPSSVGSHTSACGGKQFCLYYPPRLKRKDQKIGQFIWQWQNKRHLLDEGVLYSKPVIYFFYTLIRDASAIASIQQSWQADRDNQAYMQALTEDLFLHLIQLSQTDRAILEPLLVRLKDRPEFLFITGEIDNPAKLALHFTKQVQELLARSHHPNLSYDQTLTPLIEQSIGRFLKQRTEPDGQPCNVGQTFVHFQHLLAYDANAQNNPYVTGLPSMTAWAGLVHAIKCRLNLANQPEPCFAVLLRRFCMNQEHPLPNMILKNGKTACAPILDSRHCDLEFDLVVRLPEPVPDLDVADCEAALPDRFAGGTLTSAIQGSYGKIRLQQRSCFYHSQQELVFNLQALPSNMRFLGAVNSDASIDEITGQLQNWHGLYPVNTGFRLLGEPCQRSGGIAASHCFAEPVIGLVSLFPIYLFMAETNPVASTFWQLQPSLEGIFVRGVP